MYCPNPHSELYKELMIINKNDKDLVYYAYHEIEKLQEMGLISSKRYKMPDGTMRYTINKTITEKSLAESYRGNSGFTIDLSKKQKLDNYIKQFNISFLNTEISKSGKAIFVNITPVKNHVIKDIRNKDERKLEEGYKQNKKEGNWDINSEGDVVHPDDMYQEDNKINYDLFQNKNTNFIQFNNQLNSKIKSFLSKIGVNTINVEQILDKNGNLLSAVAVAKMLEKIIQVVENKADITTLPEEAAHFFVELLKDNQLLNKMLGDIINYPEYKEVKDSEFYQKQYKGDETLIRKEAIGKLIGRIIAKQETSEQAVSWWGRAWNKIKSIFSGKSSLFEEIASDIRKGNTFKLDVSKTLKNEFYQETNKQQETIDKLNKHEVSLNTDAINERTGKKGVYSVLKDGILKPIKKRVSDIVDEFQARKYQHPISEAQQKIYDIRAEYGHVAHEDISNIITRIIENLEGVENTPKTNNLPDSIYNKLHNFYYEFITDIIKSDGGGTKFFTEKMIYDEKTDTAGTIDLLVIHPNGQISIYDWKLIENLDKKGIHYNKEAQWNIQLANYRKILRSYGLSNIKEDGKDISLFRHTRIIPINAKYTKNKLTSIEIGNKKLEENKNYLNPVPLTGLEEVGEFEFTGDDKKDELLKALIYQREELINKEESTIEGKLKKSERLERLNKTIKDVIVSGEVKSFLEDAMFELTYIINKGIDNLNDDELVTAYKLVDYYSNLRKKGIISREQMKKYETLYTKVTNNAQDLYNKVFTTYKQRIKNVASNVGINNVEQLQPQIGLLSRLFRTLGQQNHPIFSTFKRLLDKQRDIVYNKTEELRLKIESKLEGIENYAKRHGTSQKEAFKKLLGRNAKGELTGNLINEVSSEFYDLKDKAIQDKDVKWIIQNSIFNETKYEERLASNKQIWKDLYIDVEAPNKELYNKKIKDFQSKYDARLYKRENNNSLFNRNNYFLEPNIDIWKSKELKELEKSENKELYEFYKLFTDTIKEFKEFLPEHISNNFIPNLTNDLIDQIANNGLDSIKGLGASIVNSIESKNDGTLGMINPLTGKKIHSIPLLYVENLVDAKTGKRDNTLKSYDLGKVLLLFSQSAYNYKYMSEIESSVDMLREILTSQHEVIMTHKGVERIDKVTGKIMSAIGNADTLELFNDYVNYYLYGIKVKGDDAIWEVGDKKISQQKVFSKILSIFSGKALGLNIISGTANLVGGEANIFFEGIKGKYYTNKDYHTGYTNLTTDKSRWAITFFDIDSNNTIYKKAKDLSISGAIKHLSLDQLYVFQRKGDWLIENSVLLAMLRSHTIIDGKIVRMNEERSKKNNKSLYDLMEKKGDKFEIPGLTDEAFHKFRRKVKYVYSTIKGNSGTEDINSMRMTILGQTLMQFRNWIPRMLDERAGNLRYTQDLDEWEVGKYRSFLNHTINKQILPNLFGALTSGGVLGFGAGLNSKSIEEKAKELYQKLKTTNPNIEITEEEYIALHKQNLKSTALEIQLIIVFAMILGMLKPPDDDKDKDWLRYSAKKLTSRYLNEISFFLNPSAATQILKKPIPIMNLGTDILDFTSDFFGEITGEITGDEKQIKRNKPLRRFNRLFPVMNSLESFWWLFDPNYNK